MGAMKRIISALALVALGVVACGDDDDGTDGDNGGTSGTGATSGNAGEPSTSDGGAPVENSGGTDGGGAPASPNVMCDPEVDGVCQNAMDCEFVVSGEARLTAGECGKSCLLSSPDDEACPLDCMLVEKELPMSSECATCYADAAVCGIANCAGECFADPEDPMCVACLEEKGCRSAFNDCSGLEQ